MHDLRRVRGGLPGRDTTLALYGGTAARAGEYGEWQDDYGTKLFLNMERNGNSLGFAASERQKFIEKSALPIFDGSQEYCLWLGCMGAYDPQGREIILALVKVLRHLNIKFGVLAREKCTGDPARRLGNDLLFQELAGENIEQLKAAKVAKMLSICPHCVRTARYGLAGSGSGFRDGAPYGTAGALRGQASRAGGNEGEGGLSRPLLLGRYRHVYDEPRALLGLNATVIEPPRTRDKAFCCGAGGGMMFLVRKRASA